VDDDDTTAATGSSAKTLISADGTVDSKVKSNNGMENDTYTSIPIAVASSQIESDRSEATFPEKESDNELVIGETDPNHSTMKEKSVAVDEKGGQTLQNLLENEFRDEATRAKIKQCLLRSGIALSSVETVERLDDTQSASQQISATLSETKSQEGSQKTPHYADKEAPVGKIKPEEDLFCEVEEDSTVLELKEIFPYKDMHLIKFILAKNNSDVTKTVNDLLESDVEEWEKIG